MNPNRAYTIGSAGAIFYIAGGASDDWAKVGYLDVFYIFLISSIHPWYLLYIPDILYILKLCNINETFFKAISCHIFSLIYQTIFFYKSSTISK